MSVSTKTWRSSLLVWELQTLHPYKCSKANLRSVQVVTMIPVLFLSVYSQLYNVQQFMPSRNHFKYFQGFVDQETQVLSTRIGLIGTYVRFIFSFINFSSTFYAWEAHPHLCIAGYLKCFSVSPHSFSDNNSSPFGVRKENFSISSVLLVILKLRCACSSLLHSAPHLWATPQLREPLSVSLSECFLPQ